jgi:hypothetical protein
MGRTTKAQYHEHYRDFQGKPEQIANRSDRNKARRLMEKKLGKGAIAGKDIDHRQALDKGGSNRASNLRVRSVKSNRGDTR